VKARTAADIALEAGRSAWRALAGRRLRTAVQPAVRALVEHRVMRTVRDATQKISPGPLLVSGLFGETKGVSEAARLTVRGLEAGGFQPETHDLRRVLEQGPGSNAKLPARDPGGVWLIHANAPEALFALASARPDDWLNRYRIGYWAYELPESPPFWMRASRAFHEIWTPSHFVADALLLAGVDRPIRVIPHPVSLRVRNASNERIGDRDGLRASLGLAPDTFCVLSMGDLNSSGVRKNLLGAITAFRDAFGDDPSACLVLKVQSEEDHPGFMRDADRAGAGHSNVRILTGSYDRGQMLELIASSDVLFSPHRSEGFGLSIAEAFCLGVPALATGFSGNLDFMRGVPELLIRFALRPVTDSSGVYRETSQLWAEPDLKDAAQRLRRLRADPALRRELADRGRRAVEAQAREWTPERLAGSDFCRHLTTSACAA